MKFELSIHAKRVILERNISVDWIKKVLSNPDKIQEDRNDTTLKHYLGKISEFENRVLRVILNNTTNPAVIVTVYFDRNVKEEL